MRRPRAHWPAQACRWPRVTRRVDLVLWRSFDFASVAALGEKGLQLASRFMDAPGDCALGAAEQPRRFFMRHTVDANQDQRRTQRLRQGVDALVQDLGHALTISRAT